MRKSTQRWPKTESPSPRSRCSLRVSNAKCRPGKSFIAVHGQYQDYQHEGRECYELRGTWLVLQRLRSSFPQLTRSSQLPPILWRMPTGILTRDRLGQTFPQPDTIRCSILPATQTT